MICPLCDEIYHGEHHMYYDDELGYYICNHCADDREGDE